MKYLAMEPPSRVEASAPAALAPPTDAGQPRTGRSWTVEQKLAIVGEVQESGDPVAVVARRHDMNDISRLRQIRSAASGRLHPR
ncbi:transposase [Mesorhizobium sp.]|uniref:transposase n=1 Tax=Mesorhizobium sp. TaxID=1871066 RepID=UPI00122706F8|nr:transposase [Mesorhizobium sp.]TIU42710.1 MAG: hypothetical protein E5W26_00195 [Mesorhizobium sp.]TIV62404.1 MAG: hypothetical protein E5V80_00650 [Mesorhizobium sp.]